MTDGDRIAILEAEVYNLRLYLREVKERAAELFRMLEQEHDGLPGYTEEQGVTPHQSPVGDSFPSRGSLDVGVVEEDGGTEG